MKAKQNNDETDDKSNAKQRPNRLKWYWFCTKKKKKKKEEKTREEKERGLKRVPPETALKIVFFLQNAQRNRNEILAQKIRF